VEYLEKKSSVLRNTRSLTRGTQCAVCTSADPSQPAPGPPEHDSVWSPRPANSRCHFAWRTDPKTPADSLARRTSYSWNLRLRRFSENLQEQIIIPCIKVN